MAKKNFTFQLEEKAVKNIRPIAAKHRRSLNLFVELLFLKQGRKRKITRIKKDL